MAALNLPPMREEACKTCERKFRVNWNSNQTTCSKYCYFESFPKEESNKLKRADYNKWVEWSCKVQPTPKPSEIIEL